MARLLWIVLALTYLGVFVASFPAAFDAYQSPCVTDDCPTFQLTDSEFEVLRQAGITREGYAGFMAAIEALLLTWAALGVLIYLRRSNDWIGLLVSMALIALGINGTSDNVGTLASQTPGLAPLFITLSAVGASLLILLIFMFPDGRFVPPWARYVAFPLTVLSIADPLLVEVVPPMEGAPGTLAQLAALLSGLVIGFVTQIYRYRRHSTVEQRQQTKWVIAAFLALMLVAMIWTVSVQIRPPSPGPGRLYLLLLGIPIVYLLLLAVPISMTFSILRYRLFDIDVIIKRTLTYGALTLVILGLYLTAVVALQGAFRALTGQNNQLAIVASTLLIAALFNPLRLRIQNAVNRRFFRGDYDTAQTLRSFGRSIRDEVDLARMQSQLLDTVEQSMHPAYLSLWLRIEGEAPRREA